MCWSQLINGATQSGFMAMVINRKNILAHAPRTMGQLPPRRKGCWTTLTPGFLLPALGLGAVCAILPVERDGVATALERYRAAFATMRPGDVVPIQVFVSRAIVRVDPIFSRLDGSIGCIRIVHFNERTASVLRDALDALRRQAGGALEGLVLSLD